MQRGEYSVESGVASRRGADDRRGADCPASDRIYSGSRGESSILSPSEKHNWTMHQFHGDTLFDYCKKIKSASSSKRRDRNIVPIGDDIAVFGKKVTAGQVSIVSMISVVNRMGFRCISGFFDHENKLTTCDSYFGGLCSIWIICALWNTNREVELEVEFIRVGILDRFW